MIVLYMARKEMKRWWRFTLDLLSGNVVFGKYKDLTVSRD